MVMETILETVLDNIGENGLDKMELIYTPKKRECVKAKRLFIAVGLNFIWFREDLRRFIRYNHRGDAWLAKDYFDRCVKAKQNKEMMDFMRLYRLILDEVQTKLMEKQK
jgi:hypothetical protein